MRRRCSRRGWCQAMTKSLEPDVNSKALSLIVLTSLKTGRSRLIGVSYSTKNNKPGIFLNVCPWCRAEIFWGKDLLNKEKKDGDDLRLGDNRRKADKPGVQARKARVPTLRNEKRQGPPAHNTRREGRRRHPG